MILAPRAMTVKHYGFVNYREWKDFIAGLYFLLLSVTSTGLDKHQTFLISQSVCITKELSAQLFILGKARRLGIHYTLQHFNRIIMTLSIMTFSAVTLSIKNLFATFSITTVSTELGIAMLSIYRILLSRMCIQVKWAPKFHNDFCQNFFKIFQE